MNDELRLVDSDHGDGGGHIPLHGEADFESMRRSGRFAAELLDHITPFVVPGVTTGELEPLTPPGIDPMVGGLLYDVKITEEHADNASEWVRANQQDQLKRSLSDDALPVDHGHVPEAQQAHGLFDVLDRLVARERDDGGGHDVLGEHRDRVRPGGSCAWKI